MSAALKSLIRRGLPTGLRPHRILSGSLRGVRMVTSWHDYPAGITGRTERPLLEWFDENAKPGETWLDVGAHYGYTAIALSRRVGQAGRVFAFEPIVSTAGCVAQTRVLNGLSQLTIVPIGLGTPDTLACLRLPLERGMADLTLDVDAEVWEEPLQIARFDWLWPFLNGGVDAIDGAKIDVQGMEIDVLKGMRDLLRRQQPKLVVEFHRGVDRLAVLELLREAGYPTNPYAIEQKRDATQDDLQDNCSYAFVADRASARRV